MKDINKSQLFPELSLGEFAVIEAELTSEEAAAIKGGMHLPDWEGGSAPSRGSSNPLGSPNPLPAPQATPTTPPRH